jgi:hypothetical protein
MKKSIIIFSLLILLTSCNTNIGSENTIFKSEISCERDNKLNKKNESTSENITDSQETVASLKTIEKNLKELDYDDKLKLFTEILYEVGDENCCVNRIDKYDFNRDNKKDYLLSNSSNFRCIIDLNFTKTNTENIIDIPSRRNENLLNSNILVYYIGGILSDTNYYKNSQNFVIIE